MESLRDAGHPEHQLSPRRLGRRAPRRLPHGRGHVRQDAPGGEVGPRRRPPDPGQHAGHGRDAGGPAGRLRAAPGHGHHALEPVHADHDGAGRARSRRSRRASPRSSTPGCSGCRRRRRSRSRPPRPPTTAGWRSARWRRPGMAFEDILQDVRRARVRHPRRQRHRVHQPRRDREPVGLPADPAGQRPRGVHRGPVPRPPGDARPAQPGGLQGPLRRVRVRAGLRRLAGAGLRVDGRPARVRSALPVRPVRHGCPAATGWRRRRSVP